MNRTLLIIGVLLVAGWIAFRLGWFLWRRLRTLRRPPPVAAPATCPKCGSGRLDELSDVESGHCLSCKHVWGEDKPV